MEAEATAGRFLKHEGTTLFQGSENHVGIEPQEGRDNPDWRQHHCHRQSNHGRANAAFDSRTEVAQSDEG